MASLFSVGGLASGIDTKTLVDGLIQADRAPATVLESSKSTLQSRLNAIKSMNTKLLAFSDAVDPLKQSDTFAPRSASSSNTDALDVSASSSAALGSLSITVNSLARSQQLATTGVASASAIYAKNGDTIAFTRNKADGSGTESTQVDFHGDTDLNGIASAINSAGTWVTAAVVNDGTTNGNRLVLTTRDTGKPAALTSVVAVGNVKTALMPTDLLSTPANIISTAENGSITIGQGGAGLTVTRSSNTFNDVITGLNITAKSLASNVSVAVTQDVSGITGKVQTMVDAYNTARDYFAANATYDAGTNKAGALFSEYSIRSQLDSIANAFLKSDATKPSGFRSLADMGVTFDSSGDLTLDRTKLESKLSQDQASVIKVFQAAGNAAYTPINALTQSTTGTMAVKTTQLQDNIDSMTSRIAAIDSSLVTKRAYYEAKFLAMEKTIAALQSQSTAFNQQMGLTTSSKKTSS